LIVPHNPQKPPDDSDTNGRSDPPGSGGGEDVNTLEPDEQGKTAPIELPSPASLPPTTRIEAEGTSDSGEPTRGYVEDGVAQGPTGFVARAASAQQQEVLFVPLAVSIGDGFKFGCGFFLALTLVMLVGFVLFAAMFALTNLFGLNLPITR
jgi:hypothetical protein